MRRQLHAAAIQLNSQGDLEANLAIVARLVDRAAADGAQIVVVPENFAYFGPERLRRDIAESEAGGPIQEALQELAQRHRVAIVAGGFPERSTDPKRPFNTCLVVGSDGGVRARYRKLHLFDVELPGGRVLSESATTMPGTTPVITEVEGVAVGLTICYDLRFPELFRWLSEHGAEVVVVPAAFTLQTGRDHWQVLVRARAIENQVWVVAANQWGEHPESRQSYGHSAVVDPWGRIVAEQAEGTGVVGALLDLDELTVIRRRLPCLDHRRL